MVCQVLCIFASWSSSGRLTISATRTNVFRLIRRTVRPSGLCRVEAFWNSLSL